MNALERAIDSAGGTQTALAQKIGKTQRHVWNWLNRDKKVPADMVIKVAAATGGVVTCHELRPDLYPPDFVLPHRPAEPLVPGPRQPEDVT